MVCGKENQAAGLWKGSYTVEAAWIVSISLTVIMASVLLGFFVYQNALQDVCQASDMDEVPAVVLFRYCETADDVWNLLTGD